MMTCHGNGLPKTIEYDLQKIDRVDKITYKCFFTDYLLTNKPCIVTDFETKTWKSRHDWVTSEGLPNFDFLSIQFGSSVVPVAECDKKEFNSQHKIDMTFNEYLIYWQNCLAAQEGSSQNLYLKDWHFQREYSFYEAYKTPDYFHSDWLNEYHEIEEDDYKFVYMGPKGTWTPLHADVFGSYSWSANICGRKKWWLFPPGHEKFLKDKTNKLLYFIDEKDASNYKDIFLEVIQEPGEVLFVPSGWHHQVWNIDHTISINHNWFNACNLFHILHCLRAAASEVEKELSDIMDSDEYESRLQLVLKLHHGFNHTNFYLLLKHIFNKRVEYLESLDEHYFKPWEEIYDIEAIKNACHKMLEYNLPMELKDNVESLLKSSEIYLSE